MVVAMMVVVIDLGPWVRRFGGWKRGKRERKREGQRIRERKNNK